MNLLELLTTVFILDEVAGCKCKTDETSTVLTATSFISAMSNGNIDVEKMNTTVSYIESLSDDELANLTVKLDKKEESLKEVKTYRLKKYNG